MFCRNCGNEIKDGEKFCGNCGTPVSTKAVNPNVQNPGTPRRASEVRSRQRASSGRQKVPARHADGGDMPMIITIGKWAGVAAALIYILGMFLPAVTFSTYGLDILGIEEPTFSYIAFMRESEVIFLAVLAAIAAAWVLLFHLIRHSLIGLLGSVLMVFCTYMVSVGIDGYQRYGVGYGAGFYVMLIAALVTFLTAFLARIPKAYR